ncbi:MAG: hypothetical protein WBF73_32165 [Bradyrhizobium sp.]|jgi:hypothetical protein
MNISRASIPASLSSSDLPACCHQRNEANDLAAPARPVLPVKQGQWEAGNSFQGIELKAEPYCE